MIRIWLPMAANMSESRNSTRCFLLDPEIKGQLGTALSRWTRLYLFAPVGFAVPPRADRILDETSWNEAMLRPLCSNGLVQSAFLRLGSF